MKVLLILLIIINFSLNSVSQNLVRNWSFEDTVSCPTSREQLNNAIHWFTPRGGGGSSELFNHCNNYHPTAPGFVGVPYNAFGYQKAYLGESYAGIFCYWNTNEYREYIETKLNRALNPQINYYIEFWVSRANESKYGIENIGIYFSKDTLFYSSSIPLLKDANVEYVNGIISDTVNWVKVSGYFKAPQDGFQFLTIGNFHTDDSTNLISYAGSYAAWGAYYYIENVVVIDSALQHTIDIKEMAAKPVEVKVYPNPTNGVVNIDIIGQTKGNINIQIFSINGQIVHTQSFSTRNSIKINTNGFNSGIYFIKVFDNRNLFGVEKLIIQR